jgi:hypothetical protein
MSQMKIIKQDVINSLKTNLNETNIDYLLEEIKMKSDLQLQVIVEKKSYMW